MVKLGALLAQLLLLPALGVLPAATPRNIRMGLTAPINGSRVMGPTVSVSLKLTIPDYNAAQDNEAYRICLTLDWGGSQCGSLGDIASQPINLHNVLPGWRRVRAWLEPAAAAAASDALMRTRLAQTETKFLTLGQNSASADAGDEPYDVTKVRSGGSGGCAASGGGTCDGDGAAGGEGGGGSGEHSAEAKAPEQDGVERAKYFDAIYTDSLWAAGGAGARSGTGSTLGFTQNAVQAVRSALRELRPLGVRRMLDVPCGDMTWMPAALRPFLPEGVGAGAGTGAGAGAGAKASHSATPASASGEQAYLEYTGFDISNVVVRENQERYGAQNAFFKFEQFDAVDTPLPHGRFDFIFCRHLMFHLTPQHSLRLLKQFEQSGAKYLMMTTYLRADENEKDFVLAFGHRVNLFRKPYCIRDPMRLYVDGEADMMLGLWQLSDDTGKVLPLLNWTSYCLK